LDNNSKHIDTLIARYIAGEASKKEKQELEQWMNSNESNKKYFEGIDFANDKAVSSHKIIKVEVDSAWEKVHQQMKTGRQNSPGKDAKTRTLIPNWAKVAAIALLITGLSVVLYQQANHAQVSVPGYALTSTDLIRNHTLTDSSTIILNRNSILIVADNYGKEERRLTLDGEALFEVTHNPEIPFIVESNETFIQVTGTSFNIQNFETDSLVEVYVKTGSVLFFSKGNEGIALVAGETGIYNKNTGIFTKTIQQNSNVTAYATRVFVFYNTPLHELFRQIQKVYNVEVVFDQSEIEHYTITVSFNNDNIDTILSIVSETLNLDYSFIDGQYHISNEARSSE
jgi:transmembrane sensor